MGGHAVCMLRAGAHRKLTVLGPVSLYYPLDHFQRLRDRSIPMGMYRIHVSEFTRLIHTRVHLRGPTTQLVTLDADGTQMPPSHPREQLLASANGWKYSCTKRMTPGSFT